jgi:hypothetical protein
MPPSAPRRIVPSARAGGKALRQGRSIVSASKTTTNRSRIVNCLNNERFGM